MSVTATFALTIGLALLCAALVIAKATTQRRHPTPRHARPLRAADAADHMIPGQPGDDGQFSRWYLPNIRRQADAERAIETSTKDQP